MTTTRSAARSQAPAAPTPATVPCPRCGQPFVRTRTRERFCSPSCVAGNGLDIVTQMRAEGRDPAHGGAAAEARRASLARRRAAGELLGKQLRNARLAGLVPPKSEGAPSPTSQRQSAQASQDTAAAEPAQALPPLTCDQTAPVPDPAVSLALEPAPEPLDGTTWLQAGMRYERMAGQVLAREGGQTLILAGYGAGLRVERDALVVREGCTHTPQTPITHTLYRGLHTVQRILVLGAAGSLSFEALHWCTQQQIAVYLLSRDGGLEACLSPEAPADAKLRRRQYAALENGQAGVIVRELVRRKLAGQQQTLATHPELPGQAQALATFRDWCPWLELPNPAAWQYDIDHLRILEGRLAQVYFGAWVGWPLRWAKSDQRRVPPHWLVARTRQSPLSWNGKRAVDPCNALLNYAYGCLAAQCRQSLTSAGFDVACGFLHTDKDRRDSLVYDLMELERPAVDGLVLDFLASTTLHAGDFTAVSDGSCRLHPQLARAVVARCRVTQERLDAHAKWLRDQLEKASV